MRERGRTRRLFGLGARTGGALLKNAAGRPSGLAVAGRGAFRRAFGIEGPGHEAGANHVPVG